MTIGWTLFPYFAVATTLLYRGGSCGVALQGSQSSSGCTFGYRRSGIGSVCGDVVGCSLSSAVAHNGRDAIVVLAMSVSGGTIYISALALSLDLVIFGSPFDGIPHD